MCMLTRRMAGWQGGTTLRHQFLPSSFVTRAPRLGSARSIWNYSPAHLPTNKHQREQQLQIYSWKD